MDPLECGARLITWRVMGAVSPGAGICSRDSLDIPGLDSAAGRTIPSPPTACRTERFLFVLGDPNIEVAARISRNRLVLHGSSD